MTDERLGARAVILRLKEAMGVESDAALADAIRTSRQNIAKWKSRNSVPYAEAVLVSFLRNVSLDYLLTGDAGETTKLRRPSKLDAEIVRAIMLNLHGFGLIEVSADRDAAQALDDAARAIVFQYERADEVIRELIGKKGLSPQDARAAAILATELLGSDGTVYRGTQTARGRKRP